MWILSMCKLHWITHKLNIKPFVLYLVCEWFGGIYTSIKSTKIKFIPIIFSICKFYTHKDYIWIFAIYWMTLIALTLAGFLVRRLNTSIKSTKIKFIPIIFSICKFIHTRIIDKFSLFRDESFITSWGRGAGPVTFSCDVQIFLPTPPPPQSHWKISRPRLQKCLWPPPTPSPPPHK